MRSLKNAFFMSLMHLLCRYPTILWKTNRKQLEEMVIFVVGGDGWWVGRRVAVVGFNPYGLWNIRRFLATSLGSRFLNTFMWGRALELSSQVHVLCKISTPAATTVQPTGPGRLTGKTAHNDPCLLFPQSRVCKTFLLAARVHPSIWSYFCS